ncbi:phage replisome organizer N-terminal domain-containing protein [Geomonas sp. Red69]|uniref:phage replisome organizer N-terminal domain-containing protein n=1 Tax=Geomonas diazotrophica TaxID=2843197 RepID=UPI001C108E3A|nr:phage replisome organizer N-terminal domain-containing protein [Geomonas diazotrophica]MBU5636555.1 phage replisome organizer N-terminal domain-containing protein [Geomonas diazotrophica]
MEWFKVSCNLIHHRKIEMIRKGQKGDSLALLWIVLLAEAGKSNHGGYLMISDTMPYTPETIGVVANMPLRIVQKGLETFSVLGMIDQDEGAVFIKNWAKYQSEDKLGARRESDRKRKQRQRDSEREKIFLPSLTTASRDSCPSLSRDVTLENKEEHRLEDTTQEHLRVLFAGTPFLKILDSELTSFCKTYGEQRLVEAADVAAETWRRRKGDVGNPAGYLRSFCVDLILPGWYVAFETRNAAIQARERENAAQEAELEELRSKERAETAARNAFWESLPKEDRQRYETSARSELPSALASSLTTSCVETAKFLAWEDALRSQQDRVGGADISSCLNE